jgi:hypothetical protein
MDSPIVVEPPANTPFPSFYGMEMLGNLFFSQPGNTQFTPFSLQGGPGNIVCHATASFATGHDILNIMLINEDLTTAHTVTVDLSGFQTTKATNDPSATLNSVVTGPSTSGVATFNPNIAAGASTFAYPLPPGSTVVLHVQFG